MPLDVIMPALGMAQDTGLIVAWHKHPGEAVAVGDVLFEVETDKATMEVEAQGDGFLTGVAAEAGQEVSVGQVIAQISDSAEAPAPAPAPDAKPDAKPDAIPEGDTIIMPTLGMAQDSGLLVRWLKAPGDAVQADDPLFEVETDKSTVEVAAGQDGFLAATLADEGEDVPVGQIIAIISAEKPANPVTRSAAQGSVAPKVVEKPSQAPPRASVAKPEHPAPIAPGGRILASPKARRLALEQGLDLARLVAAGHAQPFHASDIDTLRAMPVASAQTTAAAPARRLTAEIAQDGFAAFADWAAQEAGISDSDALLAGLAAASLGQGDATINVQAFERDRLFVGDGTQATAQQVPEGQPDLVLRDLRFTAITALCLGPEDQPVLTLTRSGTGYAVTFECAADQMSAPRAIAVLSAFAGRMQQPLRHLL